jgi:mitochondrial chaperone BCS1
MDIKIQYKLATTGQVEQVFKRFFPADRFASTATSHSDSTTASTSTSGAKVPTFPNIPLPARTTYTSEELDALAKRFSELVPDGVYSVAHLQGYLLRKKLDPEGAVNDVAEWIKEQEAQKRAVAELKEQRRMDAVKRREHIWQMHEQVRREARKKRKMEEEARRAEGLEVAGDEEEGEGEDSDTSDSEELEQEAMKTKNDAKQAEESAAKAEVTKESKELEQEVKNTENDAKQMEESTAKVEVPQE